MNRNNPDIETWLVVTLFILAISLPIIVGVAFYKIFRKFKPTEEATEEYVSISASRNGDGFAKTYFTGLLLTAPFYYLVANMLGY
ncbi:hypothetical protein HR060_16625 [Catenovulum sp. SM1970]|uniref:hypothetical protein n=1 Tax=Marinifaba aquimaris TaxID=2741323 RepID=UPI0015728A29|nr:hypothetical protein [Marinifaba aquimaris]NTS78470.1 hypothetical protein [Marinifaba aquimaris]